MIRRMLLAVSFVAALGVAGFGATGTAEAGHGCRSGGYGGYYGANYGYYPHVVRSSYYPPVYYGEPVYYGHSYYGGHHGHHGHGGHSGLHFSFGF